MAVRFNRLVQPGQPELRERIMAENAMRSRAAGYKMVFMSHKTGDVQAMNEANYIADRHKISVYMAEWDDKVGRDPDELPGYIMEAIRKSNGFLVNVTAEIVVSMWIGYEIGGAHAMQKSRAKIMYEEVGRLPSVVGALESLRNHAALDRWIIKYVL